MSSFLIEKKQIFWFGSCRLIFLIILRFWGNLWNLWKCDMGTFARDSGAIQGKRTVSYVQGKRRWLACRTNSSFFYRQFIFFLSRSLSPISRKIFLFTISSALSWAERSVVLTFLFLFLYLFKAAVLSLLTDCTAKKLKNCRNWRRKKDFWRKNKNKKSSRAIKIKNGHF